MVLVDEQEGQKRRLQTKAEESFLMKYVFNSVLNSFLFLRIEMAGFSWSKSFHERGNCSKEEESTGQVLRME